MLNKSNIRMIAIVGPTASGKTALSLKLAKKFNGEIINADSRLFYKDFNIVTDKPQKDYRKKIYFVKGVRHHLIDFLTPTKKFSIADFRKIAQDKAEKINNLKKPIFIVGGSPLYADSIIYNYDFENTAVDRRKRKMYNQKSLETLTKLLKARDEKTFRLIDIKNKRRIIRALEILDSGLSVKKRNKEKLQNVLILGVNPGKDVVEKNISLRADKMVRSGLLEEVRRLANKFPKNSPAMESIGYKEFLSVVNKKITLEDAIEHVKRRTRKFAKRQMTWYKKDSNIIWIKDQREAEEAVNSFLNN